LFFLFISIQTIIIIHTEQIIPIEIDPPIYPESKELTQEINATKLSKNYKKIEFKNLKNVFMLVVFGLLFF
jgi:hypothetical protein